MIPVTLLILTAVSLLLCRRTIKFPSVMVTETLSRYITTFTVFFKIPTVASAAVAGSTTAIAAASICRLCILLLTALNEAAL